MTQNPGFVEDPFGFNYEQDQQKLGSDLLEIRMVIEPWIAEQAARKATLEDIREIYDLCDRVDVYKRQSISLTTSTRKPIGETNRMSLIC